MICEACGGNGYTVPRHLWNIRGKNGNVAYIPCPACGGCGEQSCCEGEQWSDREREIEQVKK